MANPSSRHKAHPGRRTANAMHPFFPECFLMTSAADMHADSDTLDGTLASPPPSNADAASDLNSKGASAAPPTSVHVAGSSMWDGT
mmetsp:Transcript_3709/g.9435  ORF Transcript_3709/g.9435 Transcript_3709/m.9435 type:complete len:86 (-) Transcript_3709:151-408(-)